MSNIFLKKNKNNETHIFLLILISEIWFWLLSNNPTKIIKILVNFLKKTTKKNPSTGPHTLILKLSYIVRLAALL
jgi:hypothetical protein